jgi:hypothetical protein
MPQTCTGLPEPEGMCGTGQPIGTGRRPTPRDDASTTAGWTTTEAASPDRGLPVVAIRMKWCWNCVSVLTHT